MQYLLWVCVDDKLLGELPPEAFDAEMKPFEVRTKPWPNIGHGTIGERSTCERQR